STYHIEKQGTVMGLFARVIAFVPAIGPTLSGILVDNLLWSSVFYVVFSIAIIIIIASIFLLKNVTETTHPKLDIASVILATLGFGGLLYSFSSVGEAGWGSIQFIVPIIVGVVSLVIFIRRQLNLKE